MLALVVDSATPAVTAALVEIPAEGAVHVVAARSVVDARAHGELLAPQVHEVLRAGGVRPADLTAIVAGLGPGPFTGLRVGLVTAASLGQALNRPTYGVCSLDALGYGEPGTVLVATDARRREIYWAIYTDGTRVTGPAVEAPALVAKLAADAGASAVVGEGAHRYAEVLGLPVRDEPRYPVPAALAALAADRIRSRAASERLTPLYLRRPDAVQPGARKPALPS